MPEGIQRSIPQLDLREGQERLDSFVTYGPRQYFVIDGNNIIVHSHRSNKLTLKETVAFVHKIAIDTLVSKKSDSQLKTKTLEHSIQALTRLQGNLEGNNVITRLFFNCFASSEAKALAREIREKTIALKNEVSNSASNATPPQSEVRVTTLPATSSPPAAEEAPPTPSTVPSPPAADKTPQTPLTVASSPKSPLSPARALTVEDLMEKMNKEVAERLLTLTEVMARLESETKQLERLETEAQRAMAIATRLAGLRGKLEAADQAAQALEKANADLATSKKAIADTEAVIKTLTDFPQDPHLFMVLTPLIEHLTKLQQGEWLDPPTLRLKEEQLINAPKPPRTMQELFQEMDASKLLKKLASEYQELVETETDPDIQKQYENFELCIDSLTTMTTQKLQKYNFLLDEKKTADQKLKELQAIFPDATDKDIQEFIKRHKTWIP